MSLCDSVVYELSFAPVDYLMGSSSYGWRFGGVMWMWMDFLTGSHVMRNPIWRREPEVHQAYKVFWFLIKNFDLFIVEIMPDMAYHMTCFNTWRAMSCHTYIDRWIPSIRPSNERINVMTSQCNVRNVSKLRIIDPVCVESIDDQWFSLTKG